MYVKIAWKLLMMTKTKYNQCECGAILDNANCPFCKKSVQFCIQELKGIPIDGDKEYRIDTDLVLTLNEYRGKPVLITIRELTCEEIEST